MIGVTVKHLDTPEQIAVSQPRIVYARVSKRTVEAIVDTIQGRVLIKAWALGSEQAWEKVFARIVRLHGWARLLDVKPEVIERV